MNHHRRFAAFSLAAAVVLAVVASVAAALSAGAGTTPPLAWGSNVRSQLGPKGPKPFTVSDRSGSARD